MKLNIVSKSFSFKPLVVIAGEPIRIAEGKRALLSPGTVFLLMYMHKSFRISYILAPSTPLLLISAKSKWLSVPPETIA